MEIYNTSFSAYPYNADSANAVKYYIYPKAFVESITVLTV